ncbi:MAG TPA: arginine--tRNA ligase [Acidimicrobiia bacterium]
MRDQLLTSLRTAIAAAGLPVPTELALEVPRERAHGDFAANVALQLAKRAARKPREVAEAIAAELTQAGVPHLDHIEIAGPGFLNFHLRPTWLHEVLREVVAGGHAYGTNRSLAGRRINLEFVSANPTGPLHAGGARWVAVGDAIANLLASQGADVSREYYLNDTGNQLNTLRASLSARYHGRPLPHDGYQGDYVGEIAAALRAEHGDDLDDGALCELGVARIVDEVRGDLARIGVHFDTWFSERVLHERGDVDDVLSILRDKGLTFVQFGDKAGADIEWLRSTDLGDTRDRALRNVATGATTYLCNDLAYHRDKLRRGFDHLIDIWGSDHQGQVKSLQAGMEALTGLTGEPEVLLGQYVKLFDVDPATGKRSEMKMSKRAGTFVSLGDVLDRVDADVTRMTFLLQSVDTTLTFDLAVVTAQSMENPVYYIQMAHARIASIARKAADAGLVAPPLESVDLSVLTDHHELEVLRLLEGYPGALADAAEARAPHKIAHWVHEFAGAFHAFYGACRVIDADPPVAVARLWLTQACRIGLANALGILGVQAPESMARLDDDG